MHRAIESLHPGNFAFVMATGIISVALKAQGFFWLSDIFSFIAVAAWLVLLLLCTIRAVWFFKAVFIDLTSPRMVFSYFTLVAATNIVGILMHGYGFLGLAVVCWFIAFFCWCLLLYLAFSVLTFMSHESNVNIMHGGWLITIVGTQSLVLLGVKIAPFFGEYGHYMMMEVSMLWSLGLVFLRNLRHSILLQNIFPLAQAPRPVTTTLGSDGRLGHVAEFPPMIWISQIMILLALTAWVCSLTGLLARIRRVLITGDGISK